MSTQIQPTSALTIAQVGQSWVDTNLSNFMFGQAPQGFMPSKPDGYSSTTYKIPSFDNSLYKGSLIDWEPGDARVASRALGSSDVTVTPIGRSTREIGRAVNRPVANRFADLESNISNIILSQLYQGIDKDMAAFLVATANYSSVVITGTADWDDFVLDQSPMWDVLSKMIAPLRKFAKSVPGMAVEWWIEDHVVDVLTSHFNFFGTGAMIASQTPKQSGPQVHSRAGFAEIVRANLGLELKIFSGVSDTVEYGQTSSPREIAYGLCWIGVVDRRQDRWDIMSADVVKPDGSIQVAMSRTPEVVSFIEPGSEIETFVGRASYKIFNPRGTSWGYFVPVADILS